MRAHHLAIVLFLSACKIGQADKGSATETDPPVDDPTESDDPTDDPNHPSNNPNNRAPSQPEIAISPPQPTSADDLTVGIVFEGVDPDGDPVSYEYAWLIDGAPVAGETAATLPASYTRRGQSVEARVRATDTVLYSGSVTARVMIANGLPTVTADWSQPVYHTGEALQVNATGVDPDGDEVTLTYSWKRNNQPRSYSGAVVPGTDVSSGQNWEVRIEPRDQDGVGTPTTLLTTIANHAPEITSIAIAPATPGDRTNLVATAATSDADGDPVTLSYRWFINNNVVQASGSPSLSNSFTSLGDSVVVEGTPSDGLGTGTPVLSAPVVIANQVPSTPGIALRPAVPDTCGDLVCRITSASVDGDGDPVTLTFSWLRNGSPWTGATATTNRAGDTIDMAFLTPGQTWTCQVTASDGNSSAPVATASGTVADSLRADVFDFVPADAADILFVVDDSGSMAEEQARLAGLGSDFITLLGGASTSYHLGVITTDTVATAASGKLQAASGYRYITNSTPNASSVFSQMVTVGTLGSADERGRRAANLALNPPLVTGFNAGFYRDDAHLAIVVLSDEDDVSGNTPTRTAFINFLQGLKAPPYTVGFYSLVGPTGGCTTATAGTEYLAVSTALGSATRSICSPDWSPLLEAVVDDALGAVPTFSLSAWPEPGTIQVVIDDPVRGILTPTPGSGFTYDGVSNQVSLGSTPTSGAVVTITYDVDCEGGPGTLPGDTDEGDTGAWVPSDTSIWGDTDLTLPFETDTGFWLDSAWLGALQRPSNGAELYPFP
jgi:hypothetical protein